MITIETILDWFKQSIEANQPIGAGVWITNALKLNVLKEDIDNRIAEFETKMAEKEEDYQQRHDKVAIN